MLEAKFLQYMQTLYQQFSAHDAAQSQRLARYRNIEPESALFLNMQVRMLQAQHILEIGTSTGYSTLWLANAAQSQNGKVVTVEIDAARIAQAKQYAAALKLDEYIEFHHQDALQYLQALNIKFDFILLDAERDAYINYWPFLSQALVTQGSVLIVDNVLSHADEVRAFIALLQADSRFITSILNIGAGLLLVTPNQAAITN